VCLTIAVACAWANQTPPTNRVNYTVGDTLTVEDQNRIFGVCFSDGFAEDTFRFADNNGNMNGGDYKISLVSMNATW